jgi:hypothetical protein
MEPSALRHEILRRADAHEATGSSAYLDDKAIATELAIPLRDVQRQLLILEDEEQVQLAKTFGPCYSLRLTPKGMRALESAE